MDSVKGHEDCEICSPIYCFKKLAVFKSNIRNRRDFIRYRRAVRPAVLFASIPAFRDIELRELQGALHGVGGEDPRAVVKMRVDVGCGADQLQKNLQASDLMITTCKMMRSYVLFYQPPVAPPSPGSSVFVGSQVGPSVKIDRMPPAIISSSTSLSIFIFVYLL